MGTHPSIAISKYLSKFVILFVASIFLRSELAAQDTSYVINSKTGKIRIERFAKLSEPWGMTFLPDGRLLITEKPGTLRIYQNGKLSDPIKKLPKITYKGQGGLMDVEIDPNFASNKIIYLYFIEAAEQQPANPDKTHDPRIGTPPGPGEEDYLLKGGAVARAELDGDELDDLRVIWRQAPKLIGRGHFGGRLIFGSDGKLYITNGDRQRFDPAQDMSGNVGKIVRINPDGSIPNDNPFFNQSGASKDIWSVGHRNPLGGAINPVTKKLWINEMGPAHGDELNVSEAGKNYGWPVVSNGDNYNGVPIPDHPTRPEFTAPAFYYHPAISPSGMIFYTGNLFTEWKNNALVGGLSVESLIRITLDSAGNKVEQSEQISLNKRIRDIAQAPDGSVWLLTDYKDGKGELLRLTPDKSQN